MRRVLMVLTLVLCFCGGAYAGDNPYRMASARLAGEPDIAAAEYLVRFSQEGGGLDLVQKDTGFGGCIVFVPDTEPEGVYSVSDISRYDKDLYEAEEKYLSGISHILAWMFLLFIFVFAASGAAILFLGSRPLKPGLINKHSEALMIISGTVMSLMWICICGVTVFYMFSCWSPEDGKYSSHAYQTVLQEYVLSGNAEFYPREDIGKLLGKYAAMYDGQTR